MIISLFGTTRLPIFFTSAAPNQQIKSIILALFRQRTLENLTFEGANYELDDIKDALLRTIPDTTPDQKFERIKRVEILR